MEKYKETVQKNKLKIIGPTLHDEIELSLIQCQIFEIVSRIS